MCIINTADTIYPINNNEVPDMQLHKMFTEFCTQITHCLASWTYL